MRGVVEHRHAPAGQPGGQREAEAADGGGAGHEHLRTQHVHLGVLGPLHRLLDGFEDVQRAVGDHAAAVARVEDVLPPRRRVA